MNDSKPKILVIGAGAVGGITAACMKKAGRDVEIVCKYPGYSKLISGQGLQITGHPGSFTVAMPAYSSVTEIIGKRDIIIIATKATDMINAAFTALPYLADGGLFVSLQNGICEDELSAAVGADKVAGCVTGWGATMEEQGKLVMTSGGEFIIGYPGRKADERLRPLAEALSAVVPVIITDNIAGHKYSKLIINSCITSLGAVCGLYLGEMLSVKKIRKIFIEIIREAIAVADAMGIHVEVFGGRLDFRKFIRDEGVPAGIRRHLMIRLIGLKYRKLKSSSLQSLERGRLTEIDYLNGYIASNGRKLGISVPVNEKIVSIIHEIEQGKRQVTTANFNDSFFNRF